MCRSLVPLVALALVLPSAALLAGCASAPPPPKDGLAIAGRTLGTRELHPGKCYSGEHWVFLGAQLVDEASKTGARLVIDPVQGPIVRIFDAEHADEASFAVRKRDCRVFQPSLERTGSWTNGINEVSVSLTLDCRTWRGDRVRGSVSAPSCE